MTQTTSANLEFEAKQQKKKKKKKRKAIFRWEIDQPDKCMQ